MGKPLWLSLGLVVGLVACGSSAATPDADLCPSPATMCGDTCTDLSTDTANCGACGSACAAGSVCTAGACGATCPTGELSCDGECVDPTNDNRFCGATADCQDANAGAACPSGNACESGACVLSCAASQVDCNGECIDPASDPRYCGASGDCQGANAGAACPSGNACESGACELSCTADHLDCNGACIDPATDQTYCGAVEDCQGANAGTTCTDDQLCTTGTCAPACHTDVVLLYSGAAQQIVIEAGCTQLQLTAAGAQGGTNAGVGGLGAMAGATVTVTPGDTLTIFVGGQPAGNGGGGGSFIVDSAGNLLLAAGGGGGGGGPCCSATAFNGMPGVVAPAGTNGNVGTGDPQSVGGTDGQGGSTDQTGHYDTASGGGAGFLSDGQDGQDVSYINGLGGHSFAEGFLGGTGATPGGFGGGGGSSSNGASSFGAGGGGGGYSGGGGATGGANWGGGGGGGSFNTAGAMPIGMDGVQLGNGFVTIHFAP